MEQVSQYHFFWQSGNPFSNHFMHDFYVNGIKYNCVEQYMMAMKARVFGDVTSWASIMNADYPQKQKNLGRLVKNFDDSVWSAVSIPIVTTGCLAKFGSDKWLKKLLIATGDKTIVEASPYDRIWGIGYSEELAMQNIENWGENRLGTILTNIRECIK